MDPKTRFDRFWVPDSDGCHIWSGTRLRLDGQLTYGRFRFEGKLWLSHRWIFWHAHGYEPPEVCHSCDKPGCVREQCLFPGTHYDNMRDRDVKARRRPPVGELNGRSKLTASDVADIRECGSTAKDDAKWYGVSLATIYDVRSGRTW